MPRLIYFSASDKREDIRTELEKIVTTTNLEEAGHIHNLLPGDIVMQTEEYQMRGFDYDTQHPQGIALLMISDVTSQRAYSQLMGRVGRYKKPCLRFAYRDANIDFEKAGKIGDAICNKLMERQLQRAK